MERRKGCVCMLKEESLNSAALPLVNWRQFLSSVFWRKKDVNILNILESIVLRIFNPRSAVIAYRHSCWVFFWEEGNPACGLNVTERNPLYQTNHTKLNNSTFQYIRFQKVQQHCHCSEGAEGGNLYLRVYKQRLCLIDGRINEPGLSEYTLLTVTHIHTHTQITHRYTFCTHTCFLVIH